MAQHDLIPCVFLSASVPDPKRKPTYWETADLIAIREAIVALGHVVLPDYTLVYGGHPAITPVLRLVAEATGTPENVTLYQSEWFADRFPSDNQAFTAIVRTPKGNSAEESLQRMRIQMITAHRYVAAFFIGGMEGVEMEFHLLQQYAVTVPCFAVASTGAAALNLLRQHPSLIPQEWHDELTNNLAYRPLFSRILRALDAKPAQM